MGRGFGLRRRRLPHARRLRRERRHSLQRVAPFPVEYVRDILDILRLRGGLAAGLACLHLHLLAHPRFQQLQGARSHHRRVLVVQLALHLCQPLFQFLHTFQRCLPRRGRLLRGGLLVRAGCGRIPRPRNIAILCAAEAAF